MDEIRFAERLTAAEQSAKSAHHRLDNIEKLVRSIQDLVCEVRTMRGDINDLKSDMDEVRSLPRRRWDTAVTTAITAMVSGAVGYMLKMLI